MINKKIFLGGYQHLLCFSIFMFLGSFCQAQTKKDSVDVEQAVRDYVMAIYESDTNRIYRSVHPTLAKRGYYRTGGKYAESMMSFERLVHVAATWRQSTRRLLEPKIIIFDILDHTASAKLVADWGIDYMHLSKSTGTWKIYNVIWQSPPPTVGP